MSATGSSLLNYGPNGSGQANPLNVLMSKIGLSFQNIISVAITLLKFRLLYFNISR